MWAKKRASIPFTTIKNRSAALSGCLLFAVIAAGVALQIALRVYLKQ